MTAPQTLTTAQQSERILANGVRAIALERHGVARTEVRLDLPIGRSRLADHASTGLLGRTLLSGTATRTRTRSGAQLAQQVRSLGGELAVSASPDQLQLSGGVLTTNLRPFLELLAEVVATASFPDVEVVGERRRLGEEVAVARQRPQMAAASALFRRMYPRHPYGAVLPAPNRLASVTPGQLRRLRQGCLSFGEARAVVVGGGGVDEALNAAADAFGPWPATTALERLGAPATPAQRRPSVVLVDRPGAPQTIIMMGAPATALGHPLDPALQVAVTILGGYRASRLITNLSHQRGLAYHIEANLERRLLASHVVVFAAVATAATGPALVEMHHELARMVTEPVAAEELEAAQRYLCGRLSLAVQSRAGLANQARALAGAGLPAGHLGDLSRAIARVTAADVIEASRRYLPKMARQDVVVGDASVIAAVLAALDHVEIEAPTSRGPRSGAGADQLPEEP